ncbi:MAG TPA: carbon-nitrogen family hydrolase [Phycisphaerales bacterium]|nr:carbon-nitrogen family hydrolase [Phycisphaerales bacterium]
MRVHLVQMNIVWENRHENFIKVDRLVQSAPINPGDLVVLPEMFDSGFSLNTHATHDGKGETLAFLEDLAARCRCTVQGGRTVLQQGEKKATNRAPIVSPEGRLLAEYSKIHPFSFGREPEAFRGGSDVTTYNWAGPNDEQLPVCPAICYDVRFPELFRIGLLRGAEAFAVGANFPHARQDHWRALLIARAIENQAFVFAVNRTGDDPHLHYAGGSIVVGPTGEILGELGDEETVLSADIDPDALRSWRQQFPAWRDVRLIEDPDGTKKERR